MTNSNQFELNRLLLRNEALQQEIQALHLRLLETIEQATCTEQELKQTNSNLENSLQQLLAAQSQFVASETQIRQELAVGRRYQVSFLPDPLPTSPGWELATYFEPARQLSGDFYDVIRLPQDHLVLVIADVCDKGVGAALFMALIRTLLRSLIHQTPQRVAYSDQPLVLFEEHSFPIHPLTLESLNSVALANDYLINYHAQTDIFSTLFVGVLNRESGNLWYVNAGHEAPLLMGQAGLKARLKVTGPAIGVLGQARFKINRVLFEQGDVLVAYTDGVTDARSPDGQAFTQAGLTGLLEEVCRKGQPTASEILSRLEEALQKHKQDAEPIDDLTMLIVHRLNQSSRAET